MKDKIEILMHEVTDLAVDALLLPSNNELDVEDEAYRELLEKAGDALHDQYKNFHQPALGDTIMVKAGNLKAKYLLHLVLHAPGEPANEEHLMLSFRQALNLACEHELVQIATFMTACGWAQLPVKRCAELILAEIKKHFDTETSLEKIFLVMVDQRAIDAFEEGLRQL